MLKWHNNICIVYDWAQVYFMIEKNKAFKYMDRN